MKFVVAQLGARMHYAVPRIMFESGLLEHFYTDICGVKGWPRLLNMVPPQCRPNGVKRLLGRVPDGVPVDKITAFTQFGHEYSRRRSKACNHQEELKTHQWAGQQFCNLIIQHNIGHGDGVYTFNTAGLELLQYYRERRLQTVMEQTIAPYLFEHSILSKERASFPDWEESSPQEKQLGSFDSTTKQFIERERAEWNYADVILCGSAFVRDAIEQCGGPIKRCVVVPYGVRVDAKDVPQRIINSDPLRVLTVGAIGLRKGTPYILEAAKMLRGRAEFRIAGATNVQPKALHQLREYVHVLGHVPRSEIMKQFEWADVFLLPSLCEGSATVCYEALSYGLPVIVTPNAGSVVRDGIDGFVIPIRNSEAITQKLNLLASQPNLRIEMSFSARQRAKEFSLDEYGSRLTNSLSERLPNG